MYIDSKAKLKQAIDAVMNKFRIQWEKEVEKYKFNPEKPQDIINTKTTPNLVSRVQGDLGKTSIVDKVKNEIKQLASEIVDVKNDH